MVNHYDARKFCDSLSSNPGNKSIALKCRDFEEYILSEPKYA